MAVYSSSWGSFQSKVNIIPKLQVFMKDRTDRAAEKFDIDDFSQFVQVFSLLRNTNPWI